ncbi:MAG TPA: XRE family transcriptional regulator [Rhodocyclaceae bacterium]
MARTAKLNFKNIADHRMKTGLNQSEYWSRYGVTQSGGSRYETGRTIPKAVVALMWLLENGKISEKDLANALKAAAK